MKSDRPERKDGFAGFVHRLNFLLEPARGTKRAELARGVDQDWYGVGVCCCYPANVADKAAVAHVRTIRADSNDVTSCEDAEAGPSAQGRVGATGGVILERTSAVGRVVPAGGVSNVADENTATGAGALLSNTTGNLNTANGAFALFLNTEDTFNTATGDRVLFSNTVGSANSAFGSSALASNTVGFNNTANGMAAHFLLFSLSFFPAPLA